MLVRKVMAWAMAASAAMVFGACVGCSNKAPNTTDSDPEATHLGKVGEWAGEYAKAHKGKGPTSLAKLKSWAEKEKGAKDDDFVSTRDHQPYVLENPHGEALIHEAQGQNEYEHQVVYSVSQGTSQAHKSDMNQLRMMTAGAPQTPQGGGGMMSGGPGGRPPAGAGGASNPGNPAGTGK